MLVLQYFDRKNETFAAVIHPCNPASMGLTPLLPAWMGTNNAEGDEVIPFHSMRRPRRPITMIER